MTIHIFALHLAYGGIEKAVTSFANIMAERHDVRIYSVYRMPDSPAYPLDARVQVTYLLDDIPNREEFRAAVRQKAPAEILWQGLRAGKTLVGKKLAVIYAMREIKDGVIVTFRDEHAVLMNRFARPGVKTIAQLHQDHAYDKTLVRHFRQNYGRIDVFTLLSPKMAAEVREIMKANTHTHICYVPNFADRIPPEAEMARKEKTVLAVGRLHPVKGFDRLIAMFASVHEQIPDWQLVIAGDGAEEAHLRSCISEHRAESYVHLAGRLNAQEVEEAMARASVYALSSYSEGFPFVLLEAMGGSLPIVALDTRGGLDMLVHSGENGFLTKDEVAFQGALVELCTKDAEREAMARASRARLQEFTRERVAQEWYAIIDELSCTQP